MSLDPFENVWSDVGKARALKMLHDVYACLIAMGAIPMIIYGTLLGACRDGMLIPWDGDFDLCIDVKHHGTLPDVTVIRCLGYEVVADGMYNFKVFLTDGQATSKPFNWPWVDIDYYKIVGQQVHILDSHGHTFYTAPVSRTFPEAPMIFEGMTVNGPKCPTWHLDSMYPDWQTVEISPIVDHRTATQAQMVERRYREVSRD